MLWWGLRWLRYWSQHNFAFPLVCLAVFLTLASSMLGAKLFKIIFSSCRVKDWRLNKWVMACDQREKSRGDNEVLCFENLQTWKPGTEGMEHSRNSWFRRVGIRTDVWWLEPSLQATLWHSAPGPCRDT